MGSISYFAPSVAPQRLRREVVFAVAEHDNGWWDWEADPPLSEADGLPQGLAEVMKHPVAGMDRWRLGISRLAERPYASLLISDHAYWLYAAQFERDPPPAFTHHLQRGRMLYPAALEENTRRFLTDVRALQAEQQERCEKDRLWRAATTAEQRHPHARLLQTLDNLSLVLCSDIVTSVGGGAS